MSEQIVPKVVIEIEGGNVVSINADNPVDVVVLDSDLKEEGTPMITVDGVQTPYYRSEVGYGNEESDEFVRVVYKEIEEMEDQEGAIYG